MHIRILVIGLAAIPAVALIAFACSSSEESADASMLARGGGQVAVIMDSGSTDAADAADSADSANPSDSSVDLDSNLVSDYGILDGSILNDGSTAYEWLELFGNNATFGDASAVNYVANAINGYPAIHGKTGAALVSSAQEPLSSTASTVYFVANGRRRCNLDINIH